LIPEVAPPELAAWQRDAARPAPLLLDVREPWEFDYCRIDSSLSMPLQSLPRRVGELPRDRDIVVICHHGRRSFHAAVWLHNAGFARVHHLRGGVAAWADEVDPAMKRY
jgi:rhodanese-related sulfurtransferase